MHKTYIDLITFSIFNAITRREKNWNCLQPKKLRNRCRKPYRWTAIWKATVKILVGSTLYCLVGLCYIQTHQTQWNHETIQPISVALHEPSSSALDHNAMCGLFVEIQFSKSGEIQFNHIIAFGKGCVLLVSDFLLLQPKLLLRPKLDIDRNNYNATQTQIDSKPKKRMSSKGGLDRE